MMLHLIKKEILQIVLSFRFVLSVLVCTLLLSMAVSSRALKYERDLRIALSASQRYALLAEGYSSFRDLATQGLSIYRRPVPLSIFAGGMQDLKPKIYRISASSGLLGEGKDPSDPLDRMRDNLDYTFIIKVVLSLVAILLTFDAISGEKERGTLPLTFSNPVSKTAFILAKSAGPYISLALALIFGFAVALLLARISALVEFSLEDLARLLSILIFSCLYLLIFVFIGILASCLSPTSKSSLLIGLLFWITLAFVVPSYSVIAARLLRPAPGIDEILVEKNKIIDEEYEKFINRYREYQESHGGFPPLMDTAGRWWLERDRNISERVMELEANYMRRLDQQARTARMLAYISPSHVYHVAVLELADIGSEAETRFYRDLIRYKSAFVDYCARKISRDPPIPNPLTQLKLSDLPAFSSSRNYFSRSFAHALDELALMGFSAVLLFALTYLKFLKYDLR